MLLQNMQRQISFKRFLINSFVFLLSELPSSRYIYQN